MCRTIARSRQHRLLLAACGGIGFATALAFSRTFLEDRSTVRWDQPNAPFLIAGLLLLFCSVAGMRSTFAVPLALPANWIFRITAIHSPGAYFAAVRKSLIVLGALPIWIAAAAAYFWIWPGRPAAEHMLLLVLAGILLADRSLYQFRKIPFACSWLPGGVQLKMRLGMYVLLFLLFAGLVANIELETMQKFARFAVLLAVFFTAAVWARRRSAEFANSPDNRLQFEDLPPAEIFALDLRPDGEWSSDDAFVDAIDPHAGRSLAKRLRPFGVALLIALIAGFAYERVGEWQDHRRLPASRSAREHRRQNAEHLLLRRRQPCCCVRFGRQPTRLHVGTGATGIGEIDSRLLVRSRGLRLERFSPEAAHKRRYRRRSQETTARRRCSASIRSGGAFFRRI
jgi:hypothetical protein